MQILEHLLKIRREKAKQEFWQTVGNQLATIWHCEIGIANFALRISHCEILQPQNTVHLSHTHPQILSEISQCGLRNSQQPCQFRNCIAKFATLRTDCEIPTVLPSDFVLRITFSSELRFRRFWYRWKA